MLEDPSGYGRVVRAPDGTVERVVETKAPGDATELELQIREVNTGMFAFDGAALLAALERGREPTTPRASCYLPDVLPILRAHERHGAARSSSTTPLSCSGSTTASQLARRHARSRSAGSTSATCSPA